MMKSMKHKMNIIRWNMKAIIVLIIAAVILVFCYIYMHKNETASDVHSSLLKSLKERQRIRHKNHDMLDQRVLDNHPVIERNTFEMRDGDFYINAKKTRILSGAIHYFRVLPEYWEDRLKKLKAAGLNTVETYVAWNRHEEIQGQYRFEGILNLRYYIELAHSLGLYVILRPGPYICSEWEFGGLPSWLLRQDRMQVRTSYDAFLIAVGTYFNQLIPQIADLQFSRGGPIIMVQIENEYGSFGNDQVYMGHLKQMLEDRGIRQPLFVSENSGGIRTMDIPGVLKTANFKRAQTGEEMFKYLIENQPGLPLMVMEFWSGWFDDWGSPHHTLSTQEFRESLDFILESGSSVNFYMFHGGTNFGFMNGRNGANPDVTSYDYDAPLTEAGDITPKYYVIRELLVKHNLVALDDLPAIPGNTVKADYGTVKVEAMLTWQDILHLVQPVEMSQLVTMEMLDRNQGSGQSYGFILYRHMIPRVQKLHINGQMNDRALVLLNEERMTILEKPLNGPALSLDVNVTNIKENNVLDILVENTGRVTWGQGNTFNTQRKGLDGSISADHYDLQHWQVYPLEFKPDFIQGASKSSSWQPYNSMVTTPGLYRFMLQMTDSPRDTFINMQGWSKGVVFINGFNLGRYWSKGPTKTLYLPAPLLRTGLNQVIVLELQKASDTISLQEKHILG